MFTLRDLIILCRTIMHKYVHPFPGHARMWCNSMVHHILNATVDAPLWLAPHAGRMAVLRIARQQSCRGCAFGITHHPLVGIYAIKWFVNKVKTFLVAV